MHSYTKIATLLTAATLVLATANDAAAQSHPNRIVCAGDSLTRGFNANDSCGDLMSCIGNIGDDLAHSYLCGTQSHSLRSRLGAAASLLIASNGANMVQHSWGQTSGGLNAGGGHTVAIGLGGNDLMKRLGATLPTQAEFRTKVRDSLHALVHAPQSTRPANVVLVPSPDVVRLRNLMRNQKHFAFETCQGIWDDFSGAISSGLKVCQPKWWNPLSWLCGIANLLQRWTNFVNALKDAAIWVWGQFGTPFFPGGYVLNSQAPASNLTLASARQAEFNTVMAQEAANYNGINGVRVVYAGSTASYSFDTSQVSRLDCFHASRAGQKVMAELVWNDVNHQVYAMGSYGGPTGAGANVAVTTDTIAPKVGAGWTGEWANNWSVLRQQLTTVRGSASDPSGDFAEIEVWAQQYGYDNAYNCKSSPGCYVGKLREPATSHSLGIAFVDPYGNPDAAGWHDYWRSWVRPSDARGNAGTLYASPWF